MRRTLMPLKQITFKIQYIKLTQFDEWLTCVRKEKKQDVPVAIIQNGTTKNEKIGIGTVASIEKKAREQRLSNPAIIVIGKVVEHRQSMIEIKEKYTLQEPVFAEKEIARYK